MFTDMVGYSALSQSNETTALELLQHHRALVRSLLPEFHGEEIKTIGDAFLVEFPSTLDAVHCALQIQNAHSSHNESAPDNRKIQVRIGIHVGDVTKREGDVLGDAVNIAARIYPVCKPGSICISEDVYRQIGNKIDVKFSRLATAELKNITLPVELYSLSSSRGLLDFSWAEPLLQRLPSRRTLALINTALAIITLGMRLWQFTHISKPPETFTDRSVAVLPFLNLSPNKADAYFSAGMTEELTSRLSKIGGLKVVSGESVAGLNGVSADPLAIGKQLGVHTLFQGTIRRSGNKLRITANLLDAEDGNHRWSDTYERDFKDVFHIQDEISRKIASVLKIQLMGHEKSHLSDTYTKNLEVYDLYLNGTYYTSQYTTEDVKKGIEYLNQAVALDTTYAPAYAALAEAYFLATDLFMSSRDGLSLAREMGEKAIRLDEKLPEAHASVALVNLFAWNWSEAEDHFKRSLALNPNDSWTLDWYGIYLTAQGRFDEGEYELKRALDLDPRSNTVLADLGFHYYLARDFDKAATFLRRAIEIQPEYITAHIYLGWTYIEQGDLRRALTEFETARQEDESPDVIAAIGYVYSLSNKTARARKVLTDLQARTDISVPPSDLALIFLGLQDKDSALRWCERALEQQDSNLIYLKVDPGFDKLGRKSDSTRSCANSALRKARKR